MADETDVKLKCVVKMQSPRSWAHRAVDMATGQEFRWGEGDVFSIPQRLFDGIMANPEIAKRFKVAK